jgi:dephospho-CoA kinase
MKKIGITGGIGSGKSTVCQVWQNEGAYVINADDLAKELMTNNEPIRQLLLDTFGQQTYHPDGSLNRTYLAEQAFEKGRVEQLNAIVHPHIPAEVSRLMENADKQGVDVAVYEAALLLQNLRPDHLDCVVLVLADEERRLEWVQERDQTDREQVLDRIEKQQNFEELTHRADFVIKNDDSLEALKNKADILYHKFTSAKTD